MKVRIKGDSIRLRLSQSEVQRFGEEGKCVDRIRFGPRQQLIYSLQVFDEEKVGVCYAENEVSIWVPKEMAKLWVNTEQVGISATQQIDEQQADKVLTILIEKDFACLVPRSGEEDSDTFPNPLNKQDKN